MSRSFSGMVVRIHAQEIRTLHYVTVAHGVGAGLVIDGNIYKGAQGIAGKIGHMGIDYMGPRCECNKDILNCTAAFRQYGSK